MKTQIRKHLNDLQTAMKANNLWEEVSPSSEDIENTDPFCVSTLSPTQWLQWVFIPRMNAILEDENAELPRNFAITSYLEESLKNTDYLLALHAPLCELEALLK